MRRRIWHFHYYPPLSGGGLARYVLDFLEVFASTEQHIVYSREVDSFADDSESILKPGNSAHLIRFTDFRVSMVLPNDLLLFHVTHSPHENWLNYRELASLMKGRCIFVLHTEIEHSNYNALTRLSATSRKRFVMRAYCEVGKHARIIVFTKKQATDVKELSGHDALVAPLPIASRWLDPPDSAMCRSNTLLYIGERNAMKGYDRLLKLIEKSSSWLDFMAVGSGELAFCRMGRKNVKELSTVPYNESLRYLAQARALLMPSRSESWGRVILEALLYQVPILAFSKVGVLREIPDEWISFLPQKEFELNEVSIVRLLRHAERNGANARAWVLAKNDEYRDRWRTLIFAENLIECQKRTL